MALRRAVAALQNGTFSTASEVVSDQLPPSCFHRRYNYHKPHTPHLPAAQHYTYGGGSVVVMVAVMAVRILTKIVGGRWW